MQVEGVSWHIRGAIIVFEMCPHASSLCEWKINNREIKKKKKKKNGDRPFSQIEDNSVLTEMKSSLWEAARPKRVLSVLFCFSKKASALV